MSILIKGMEMPKTCRNCLLQDRLTFACRMNGKYHNWGLTYRPSDCPLIEVPDDVQPVKHGEWSQIKILQDGYKAKECSACKATFWDLYHWKYCPNCGADMRGE